MALHEEDKRLFDGCRLLARLSAMAVLGFIVQLPLAVPPLASGVLLLFLIGPYGPLGLLGHGTLTDSRIKDAVDSCAIDGRRGR
jgi:hypothetical protein